VTYFDVMNNEDNMAISWINYHYHMVRCATCVWEIIKYKWALTHVYFG